MVRLDAFFLSIKEAFVQQFQFLHGAIGCSNGADASQDVFIFQFLHGAIGWPTKGTMQITPEGFQFLHGAIGCHSGIIRLFDHNKFQFLHGAIG